MRWVLGEAMLYAFEVVYLHSQDPDINRDGTHRQHQDLLEPVPY